MELKKLNVYFIAYPKMSNKKTFYQREFKTRKPNYSDQEIIFILEKIQLFKTQSLLKKIIS